MSVKPIPDGFHSVTPYLLVAGIPKIIEFLEKAFGAVVTECVDIQGGFVAHAEVRIGDSMVMMGDPQGRCEPTTASLYLFVPDTDAVYQRAIEAGGESVMEPANQFYGDRNAGVKDPAGNTWWIATRVENVPPDELKRRERPNTRRSKSVGDRLMAPRGKKNAGRHLEEIRAICLALPDTEETITWGEPHFRVNDKIFAGYGKVKSGGYALSFKLKMDHAREIIKRPGFSRAPYVGHKGWVSMDVNEMTDWDGARGLILESYLLIAPKRSSSKLTGE